MPNLLHIDSSAAGGRSVSRAVTGTFADAWRGLGGSHAVTYRDLHAEPLPHLADATLHWPPRLRPDDAAPPADAETLQRTLIDELLAADVVLIGAPMYNYSLPSALKAWIDHIHVPGLTSPFDVDSQPMAGRPVAVVVSRGGSYDPGSPTAGWDHGVPVLELVLGTALGMSVEVITTDLTLAETVPALAPELERSGRELAEAHAAAAGAARRLGR
jgi:FMN-dependent NADH-azoreductase